MYILIIGEESLVLEDTLYRYFYCLDGKIEVKNFK